VSAENSYTNNSTLIRVDVFVDGNEVDSVEIDRYSPGYSVVDVSGARSVALEATCLEAGRTSNVSWCPSVVFLQTLLER